MHVVVGNAQIRNAGALFLPLLELDQKIATVRLQPAQLVELRAIAVGDDAAVEHTARRLRMDRARKKIDALLRRAQIRSKSF